VDRVSVGVTLVCVLLLLVIGGKGGLRLHHLPHLMEALGSMHLLHLLLEQLWGQLVLMLLLVGCLLHLGIGGKCGVLLLLSHGLPIVIENRHDLAVRSHLCMPHALQSILECITKCTTCHLVQQHRVLRPILECRQGLSGTEASVLLDP
jgi:hypothetical protein